MSGTRTLTITLPAGLATLIDVKVASGEYADASDVVSEGLLALPEDDGDIEEWLRSEVVPTLDALDRDPSQLRSSEDVRRALDEAYKGMTTPR